MRSIPILRFASLILLLAFVGTGCDSSDPQQSDGEWSLASPASQGLSENRLDDLTTQLKAGNFAQISSLLIVRNGHLVYEEYFQGMDATQLHRMYSVTKSITSLLVGIAMQEGSLNDVEAPLISLLPNHSADETIAQHQQITLEHVLQMRAGFEWDEWSTPYNSPENPTAQLVNSRDWIQFMLDQPFTSQPGTSFTYNSGVTMLLSEVLAGATGETTADFAKRTLFNQLGISNMTWDGGPNNLSNTGWGLHLRPRDMAKIGQMVLQDGTWENKRIVPERWIDASTQPYSQLDNDTAYGYQWWLMRLNLAGQEVLVPYAEGYGHQFIVVIEPYNMVVVTTAENYNVTNRPRIREILTDYILP